MAAETLKNCKIYFTVSPVPADGWVKLISINDQFVGMHIQFTLNLKPWKNILKIISIIWNDMDNTLVFVNYNVTINWKDSFMLSIPIPPQPFSINVISSTLIKLPPFLRPGYQINGAANGITSPDSKVHGANMGPTWETTNPTPGIN